MSDALLVFAKAPRPGHVKTRLTPVLTPAEAARLYTAFLRDALRQYEQLPVDVHLHVAPPIPDPFRVGGATDVSMHEQEGEGLGARMRNAFQWALGEGYERAAVVGTDHPTLPPSFVRQSFEALQADPAICIGPSEDGGFYLLGMSAFYPHLFADMQYSHERVLNDTLARIGTTDAALTVLPRWYDVDTPDALGRLLTDLEDDAVDAPNTRRIVAELNLEALA
jgi:rSAM/selenodomain-associated transferase 1